MTPSGEDDWYVDPQLFAKHRLRRQLGVDDGEFAWPQAPWGGLVLPETVAINDVLCEAPPAVVHASLHGLGVAPGMWMLGDAQALRLSQLWQTARDWQGVFGTYDDQRRGGINSKGFHRAGCGFSHLSTGLGMRWWHDQWLSQHDLQRRGPRPGYGSWEAAVWRNRQRGHQHQLVLSAKYPYVCEGVCIG